MTADRHGQVTRLFGEARALPAEQRRALLREACAGDEQLLAEVLELLDLDSEQDGFLETGALGEGFRVPDPEEITNAADSGSDSAAAAAPLPEQIGPYRILGLLGAGGMGTVYRARQEAPSREVALKVVRLGLAGESTVRRFQQEAELLGRLDHPGIARIYDAGTADVGHGPQPYLAMELVRGQQLLEDVEARQLSVPERVALLARIADAVHHAHQKGVVHRDLKPDNIMVAADGQPRILDFGVARSTDGAAAFVTRQGQLVGTLAYMSPEQVDPERGDVDVRSDVWALGVIGYELLTGQLPHGAHKSGLAKLARAIVEVDAPLAGKQREEVRGDLEMILAHCLERDPERRYNSASELAADLRRYLAHEPISARPATISYQLAKLIRRHRAATVAVVLLLSLPPVVVWQWQERAALHERQELTKGMTRDYLRVVNRAVLELEQHGQPLDTRTVLEILGRSVDENEPHEERLAATLWIGLARLWQAHGDTEAAIEHYRRGLATWNANAAARHSRIVLTDAHRLMRALEEVGRFDEARTVAREQLPIKNHVKTEHAPLIVCIHAAAAEAEARDGEFQSARELLAAGAEILALIENPPEAPVLDAQPSRHGPFNHLPDADKDPDRARQRLDNAHAFVDRQQMSAKDSPQGP